MLEGQYCCNSIYMYKYWLRNCALHGVWWIAAIEDLPIFNPSHAEKMWEKLLVETLPSLHFYLAYANVHSIVCTYNLVFIQQMHSKFLSGFLS